MEFSLRSHTQILEMAHSTRSKSNQSMSDSSAVFTAAEAEAVQQRLVHKERVLSEQADALAARQLELETRERGVERKSREYGPSDTTPIAELFASFKNEIQEQLLQIKNRVDTQQSGRIQETLREKPFEEEVTQPTIELSPLRLKDVADSIPKYDGQRMSVFQFCQACERALQLIPKSQELHLVQLITGKLQGHAYTATTGSYYPSVAALLRKLKRIFGPNKSLNQCKGELGNAFMRPAESIFDYIARLRDIQTAILDCELEQHGQLDRWTIEGIEHDVLESFVNGLPSDLLVRLKIEGYENLDDAFTRAIQLSKTLETEALRRKSAYTPKVMNYPRRDAPPPRTEPIQAPGMTQPISQRPAVPFIKPLVPGQPGPNTPATLTCYYCKTPGHLMANCRKLAYRNQVNAQENIHKNIAVQKPNEKGNDDRAPTKYDVQRDTTEKGRHQAMIAKAEETIKIQDLPE